MEFDELKEKYTELREYTYTLLEAYKRERVSWSCLFTQLQHTLAENELLHKEIKAYKQHVDEPVNPNLKLTFRKETEKFESEFPSIESNEKE